MNKQLIFILSIILCISSCTDEKKDVENYTRCFFASLSDSNYGNPSDYYQKYDSLGTNISSDILDLDRSQIYLKDDMYEVHCLNSYTDESGTFRQDSIILCIKKDKTNDYFISSSQGLVNIEDDYQWFGYATGAFKDGQIYNDIERAKRKAVLGAMLLGEYYSWQFKLTVNVNVLNWTWETSYDGDAHGEGRVVNNLDIPISDIKYKITYFDYHHHFMAEDDGTIYKTLAPGEKYNFSFWSSNAKNPSKAKIELEFSDKQIYKLIKNQHYKGNEYEEYIKGLENSREEKNLLKDVKSI